MMGTILASAATSTMGAALGLIDLDIDGFLLSDQFLSALANVVSSLILAFLNMFLLGGGSGA